MPRKPAADSSPLIRVRMYRQGLGDCFLLSFPKEKPGERFHVLVDCGLITVAEDPKTVMQKVAADIATATNEHLDLVVLTHEHWDHVSGFSTQQAQAVFNEIEVDQVWYAWTEQPGNPLGEKLRKEREEKARAVQKAAFALNQANDERAKRIGALLTFFGIEDAAGSALAASEGIGKVRAAFDYVRKKPGVKQRFCHPTDAPVELPGVPGLRVYALGPPENEAAIKRSDPSAQGKEVYEFAAGIAVEQHLMAAFSRRIGSALPADDSDFPFDTYLQRKPEDCSVVLQTLVTETWGAPGEQWRQIENDWMSAAETLALALDKHTNNTSLALAFELTESGRVLLFAADAQVGNWLSWQDLKWEVKDGNGTRIVTGPDLLGRTVLYKVGHHGSHNATLREKGLEQMTSPELVALVPVNKAQAEKNRWFEIPFEKLMQRLREKTRGRVIVSDSAVPRPGAMDLAGLSLRERDAFNNALAEGPDSLYYEFSIEL